MKIITIPTPSTIQYKTGLARIDQKTGERTDETQDQTFFEFLETLVHATQELGKGGAKGARRIRKITAAIDMAEAEGLEVVSIEDADYELLKKTHIDMPWNPRAAEAMLEFFEAFESPVDQTGPAPAPRKPEGAAKES